MGEVRPGCGSCIRHRDRAVQGRPWLPGEELLVSPARRLSEGEEIRRSKTRSSSREERCGIGNGENVVPTVLFQIQEVRGTSHDVLGTSLQSTGKNHVVAWVIQLADHVIAWRHMGLSVQEGEQRHHGLRINRRDGGMQLY